MNININYSKKYILCIAQEATKIGFQYGQQIGSSLIPTKRQRDQAEINMFKDLQDKKKNLIKELTEKYPWLPVAFVSDFWTSKSNKQHYISVHMVLYNEMNCEKEQHLIGIYNYNKLCAAIISKNQEKQNEVEIINKKKDNANYYREELNEELISHNLEDCLQRDDENDENILSQENTEPQGLDDDDNKGQNVEYSDNEIADYTQLVYEQTMAKSDITKTHCIKYHDINGNEKTIIIYSEDFGGISESLREILDTFGFDNYAGQCSDDFRTFFGSDAGMFY